MLKLCFSSNNIFKPQERVFHTHLAYEMEYSIITEITAERISCWWVFQSRHKIIFKRHCHNKHTFQPDVKKQFSISQFP